ncbi:MFS transporter [Rhodococcus sp. 2.95]
MTETSTPNSGATPAISSPPVPLGIPGLLATLSALLLSVVSFSATGIAVPDIGASLHASAAEQSLVVSAYSLGFAVPLVLAGRLGDLYGRRRLFLLGMAGFTLFSLAATFSPNITVLITARALTGISAAAMVPQVLATITASTQGRERARAVGLFGATAGGATAIGQVLGGVLLSVPLFGAGWRTVFAVSVVMGALSFLAALRWVPATNSPGHRSLDLVGTLLLGAALISLLVPVSQGAALGWPIWCWVLLVAAPFLFALFWVRQLQLHRADTAPLVPPPLLRLASYRLGLVMALMLQSAFGAFTFVYALTTQTGLGWTPLHAALVLLPFALSFFAVSVWSGKLTPRFRVPTASCHRRHHPGGHAVRNSRVRAPPRHRHELVDARRTPDRGRGRPSIHVRTPRRRDGRRRAALVRRSRLRSASDNTAGSNGPRRRHRRRVPHHRHQRTSRNRYERLHHCPGRLHDRPGRIRHRLHPCCPRPPETLT